MKSFFPNIETAVIFVFLICVLLWGASRCRQKKDDAALKTSTESNVSLLDTLPPASPAATRNAATKPRTTTTVTPQTNPSAMPLTTISMPNPPGSQPQQGVVATSPMATPQQYSTTVTPQTAPRNVPMPNGKVVTTQPQAAAEPSGTQLYVLQSGANLRAKPDLKAKSLGKLKLDDRVTFLNEKSENITAVRLADGTQVTKPWFKVRTKRGTVGWVHGALVDFYKRKPSETF